MSFSQLKSRALGAGPSLISQMPKPFSNSLKADYFYLFALAVLQTSILPTILPDFISIDLLTPWIVLVFICQKAPGSLVQGLLAALLIETHSAAPAGLYICTYWILGAAITLMRGSLSWHSRVSWISLIIFGQTWVFTAEFFVAYIEFNSMPIDYQFYVGQGFRIIFAALFGTITFFSLKPIPRTGRN